MDKLEKNDKKQFAAEMGKRLYDARLAAGLSQGDAAKIGDTYQQSISEAEHGKMFLPPDVMYRLCKAYGISCDYLISGVQTNVDFTEFDIRLQKLNERQFHSYKAIMKHFLDALNISGSEN